MLHLVIWLLASGCVTLCSRIHREYHLISEANTWAQAQSYCRNSYTDLASVGNQDDMQRLVKMAAASGLGRSIWIGLEKGVVGSWMWSVGEAQTTDYTNWASPPDSSHNCGGMRGDGKWLSASCGANLPFVCQEGEGSSKMHVVLEEKSWRNAQGYCRQNYHDLASVSSQTENQALQQMLNERGPSMTTFWIGLFRDQWKWSDQSNSSFRYWASNQPNNDGECVLHDPSYKTLWDRGCGSSFPFYCYNAVTWRHIVRMELKSDSSLNFGDSATSEGILAHIQKRFEGARVQWRVQPDGRIFKKKE
ncbi:macrophage mannose receptor 1-like [Sparus aurata]|uniref:macrophage mannose receptor 1-like n=1 Tax=Sparus aurata TaxID=8175 RepID=UPI0011C0F914|nr:macrophage mannose receptor 1-like [Sparus aurata]